MDTDPYGNTALHPAALLGTLSGQQTIAERTDAA